MRKRIMVKITSTVLIIIVVTLTGNYKLASQSEESIKVTEGTNNKEFVDVQNYYYEQLIEEEKKIYKQLDSSKQKIMKGEEICVAKIQGVSSEIYEKVDHYLQRSIWAYRLDHPISTLWFNHYDGYMRIKKETENSSLITVEIMITPGKNGYYDFDTQEELEEAIKEVEQKTKDFVQQLSGTNEEKLRHIVEWLLQGTIYDATAKTPNMNTLFGCIIQKKCVCGGLAYSFKYLADQAKIPVISVIGNCIVGEKQTDINHVWNMAWIDGKWKQMDITNILENGIETNPLKTIFQSFLYYPTLFQVPYS